MAPYIKEKDIADYYDFIERIGKGSFGKIYIGVHLKSGDRFAIKKIYKRNNAN